MKIYKINIAQMVHNCFDYLNRQQYNRYMHNLSMVAPDHMMVNRVQDTIYLRVKDELGWWRG